jgi:hypothetical protein
MDGGKLKFPHVEGVRRTKDRNFAGFLKSSKQIEDKEAILESIFEELKRTGDIDQCMEHAEYPGEMAIEQRNGWGDKPSGGAVQSYRNALDQIPDDDDVRDEIEEPDYDVDIHVPK